MPLSITTELDNTEYTPSEVLRGEAVWSDLGRKVDALTLRLIYFTEGKGTQDVVVVEEQPVAPFEAQGRAAFSFTLPVGPYSFSGKLISLIWAVEFVSLPNDESAQARFVLSPNGKEITLGTTA